jgi:hypothetical protein
MSESEKAPSDETLENKAAEEIEPPEVVAHQAEEEPWCAIYSCGSLAPN